MKMSQGDRKQFPPPRILFGSSASQRLIRATAQVVVGGIILGCGAQDRKFASGGAGGEQTQDEGGSQNGSGAKGGQTASGGSSNAGGTSGSSSGDNDPQCPTATVEEGSACRGALDCDIDGAKCTCEGGSWTCSFRSCVGLATTCRGESCCTTIAVPGGQFMMGRGGGDDNDAYEGGSNDELPDHPVTVSDYSLDKYEVTIGRFRTYVESGEWVPKAGAGAHPNIPGSGWNETWNSELPTSVDEWHTKISVKAEQNLWTNSAEGNEAKPMAGLGWLSAGDGIYGWHAAFAFCVWDGGRLPTEAEWEYAAAGGNQERRFPWASGELPARGCEQANWAECAPDGLRDVGLSPAGDARWGHADMAGNVSEFPLDGYNDNWYSAPAATGTDVLNPRWSNSWNVVRGGDYDAPAPNLRSVYRAGSRLGNNTGSGSIGFRCARNPR